MACLHFRFRDVGVDLGLRDAPQIVRPPRAFQRHHSEVRRSAGRIAYKFDSVGHRVERFDRVPICICAVGIAFAVNQDEIDRRRVDL